MPRAHRSSRSAAPGPRRQPLRNPRRNFDANKNSGNSRAFLQHAEATGRFARCRARRWRHPGTRTRACPQAEKNFSRHAPFRHRTRANAQNCANFFALFGACERACAAPRSASPPRRRCRCSVRMSAHAPHRHITHTRPDASRVLLPPRPLPSACLASSDPQHRARTPRRTHPTGRTRRRRPTLAAAQQALLRSADAAPATPDCDAHHRHCQKTGATFAASRHRCSGAAFQHVATVSCASMRAARPASAAWRGASGACVASARRYAAHADMPIARSANVADCRQRATLPAAAFVCAAQTKTGRTRRPVRLSRRGARLSGRLPRAARRSRPASAGRSTAPDRRSPARRSSLRRRHPR